MPSNGNRVMLYFTLGGLLLLLVSLAAFIIQGKGKSPASGSAAGANAGQGANPAPLILDLTQWTQEKNGCSIEQIGSTLHVFGTNSADGWGRENTLTSKDEYPVQNFEVATDFMEPRFKGTGMGSVILRARQADYNQLTLQHSVQGKCYILRWWTTTAEGFATTTLPEFGDESTTFHRLRLTYDAATHVATGYADDKVVGTVNHELRTNLRIVLGASTEKKGNDIDIKFDHTSLTLAGRKLAPVIDRGLP